MRPLLNGILALIQFLYQSVNLAIGQIWANKTRSFLTMLGIIIGVGSVTAVIAALSGLQAKILTQVQSLGTNTIFIWPNRPTTGPKANAPWWEIRFKPEHFDNLLTYCPSVARFGRTAGLGRYTISFRDKSVEQVEVSGTEPAVLQIQHRTVSIGRLISQMDELQARQVCLIDPRLRDKLLLDKECIGQAILIGHHPFIIVGLLEPRPSSIFGGQESENLEVFIPFQTSFRLNRDPWIMAMAESRSAGQSEEALAELRSFLRRTRQVAPGEPDTFNVQSLENELRTFNKIALVVTAVAGGIVGVSLLVGGVGIMNIMLVSVSERTREIGLRKAVGARRVAILAQFLIEALVLCLMGGLLGVGLGQLLTWGIANIPKAELDMAYIPWQAIVLAFLFSGAVGIFFGMFPAIKAARLDPIEALRHE